MYWELLRKINAHNYKNINSKKINVLILDNLLYRKGNYRKCLEDLNNYIESISGTEVYVNVLGYIDGCHNNNYYLKDIKDGDLIFSYFYNKANQVLEKPLKIVKEEIKLEEIQINSIRLKEDSYLLHEEGLVRNDDVILIKNRKYKVLEVINIRGVNYLKLNKGLLKYDLNVFEVLE